MEIFVKQRRFLTSNIPQLVDTRHSTNLVHLHILLISWCYDVCMWNDTMVCVKWYSDIYVKWYMQFPILTSSRKMMPCCAFCTSKLASWGEVAQLCCAPFEAWGRGHISYFIWIWIWIPTWRSLPTTDSMSSPTLPCTRRWLRMWTLQLQSRFWMLYWPPWWGWCSRRWRRGRQGTWRWSAPAGSSRFQLNQTSWCSTFPAENFIMVWAQKINHKSWAWEKGSVVWQNSPGSSKLMQSRENQKTIFGLFKIRGQWANLSKEQLLDWQSDEICWSC